MFEAFSILLTFAIILLLLRRKVHLGYSLLTGSVVLGLFANMTPIVFINTTITAMTQPEAVLLLSTVVLLSILGYILRETGSLQSMVDSLHGLFKSKKVIISLIPGLIGLVSVPGAAIISAPMVDEVGNDLGYNAPRKAAINMIFRHVWFPAYPMAASLISLAAIGGTSIYQHIRFNLPASIAALIVAVAFTLRTSAEEEKALQNASAASTVGKTSSASNQTSLLSTFMLSTAPIFVSLVLVLGFQWSFPLSLLVGISSAFLINRISHPKDIKNYFLKGFDFKIAMAIVGVMVFKEIVQESGFVISIVSDLVDGGVSLNLLLVIMPMFVAMATGNSMAAIAIILPILLPLLPAAPQSVPLLSMLYISATFGYFFSPLHLCLLLTNEYFRTEYTQIYRYAIPPMLAMFATAFIMTFLI